MIVITPEVSIPLSELTFTTSRSGGPGGQNVNKVSSRVSLQFWVEGSPSLSPLEKVRVTKLLKTRINKEGVLQLHAQASRSQTENRKALIERFALLIRQAIVPPVRRKKMAIPQRVHEVRLQQKKCRGQLKKGRGIPQVFDE